MFAPDQYQLVDFGDGRKLERFGSELLDRPSPAAEGAEIANPDAWGTATARFELGKGGKGQWTEAASSAGVGSEPWTVRHGEAQLLMQLNPSGNVGIFPEQASNWEWIGDQVRQCRNGLSSRRPRVLNLFAYTGGASLTAAAAGAEVTHIDSSAPTVAWAKRNAGASALDDLPIRWIVEDAVKFVERECRRANRYDGIIADPPTYGHGPKGRPFKFGQHVDELMERCAELLGTTDAAHRFLLFSCHAPGVGPTAARSVISRVLPDADDVRLTARPLLLESVDGRQLSAGVSARWSQTQ